MGIGHDQAICRKNKAGTDTLGLFFFLGLRQLGLALFGCLLGQVGNGQPKTPEKIQHLFFTRCTLRRSRHYLFGGSDVDHGGPDLLHQIGEVR